MEEVAKAAYPSARLAESSRAHDDACARPRVREHLHGSRA